MKQRLAYIFVLPLTHALFWHHWHRNHGPGTTSRGSCPLGSPCVCRWDRVNSWPHHRDSIDCNSHEIRTSQLPQRRSTLRPNKSFKAIDLSDNKLEDIPSGYLNHMIKLEVLNFSHNSMRRVPTVLATRALRCKHNLRKLYLDNNKINLEEKLRFVHLTRLNVLSMKNNLVGRIQLTTFRGLCRLTHLDLSNNQIAHMQFSAFRHMVILKELDLSRNRLTSLGRHVFPRLGQLQFLDLSSNLLMRLPRRFFSRLFRLQTLDISRNAFETLTSTYFSGISDNLRNFSANYNHITTFASNFFDIFFPYTSYKSVEIQSNVCQSYLT